MKPSAQILKRLRRARGFVFDHDGTLVLGDDRNHDLRPLPGAVEFVKLVKARNIPFVTLTNGTIRVPAELGGELRRMGFPIEDDRVMTPSVVAADYLSGRGYRRIMVMGGAGVSAPLAAAGMEIVKPESGATADALFVGWFREVTIAHMEAACEAVWNGAKVYTASLSPFFATSRGRAMGTSRAICAVITSITGKRAIVLGKPSRYALMNASHRLGIPPADLVVIGDDPALEPLMARSGGALAVGVESGLAKAADFNAVAANRRPQLVVKDLAELLKLYRS